MNTTAFELFLVRAGRRERTVQRHCENISRLLKADVEALESKDHCERVLLSLKQRGLKNNSLNNFISSIRQYADFTNSAELRTIKYFKKSTFSKATLSDEEIEDLLNLEPINGQSLKDFAMWTLFFKCLAYSGLRPGELATAQVQHVDFGRNLFILEITKTNESRNVPIHPALKAELQEYIKDKEAKDYLFPCKRGGLSRPGIGIPTVGAGDWGYNFKKRCARLGLKRPNLSVYSLRHSFCTSLLADDASIYKVQRLMGHRRLDTTLVYTHLTSKDDQKTIQRLSLGRKTVHPKETLKNISEYVKSLVEDDERFSWIYSDTEIIIRLKE